MRTPKLTLAVIVIAAAFAGNAAAIDFLQTYRLARQNDAADGAAEHRGRIGDALFAHLFPVVGYGGKRLLGHAAAPCHQIGRAVGAMLGLDQQIETSKRAVDGVVGKHDQFTGPCG